MENEVGRALGATAGVWILFQRHGRPSSSSKGVADISTEAARRLEGI